MSEWIESPFTFPLFPFIRKVGRELSLFSLVVLAFTKESLRATNGP